MVVIVGGGGEGVLVFPNNKFYRNTSFVMTANNVVFVFTLWSFPIVFMPLAIELD